MYHGGTNPMGALSTFQESRLSGYPNDLPIRTYDFHAPLGEAGQPRPQYHGIRALGALTATWGAWLAPMPSFKPALQPTGPTDTSTLRAAARSTGTSGLLFLNNRNINVNMSVQPGVRVALALADGSTLHLPSANSTAPDLPAGSYGAWAFHLPLPGVPSAAAMDLIYATATPLTILPPSQGSPPTLVLHLAPGVDTAELAFAAYTLDGQGQEFAFSTCAGECGREGGVLYARRMPSGLGAALTLCVPARGGAPLLTVLLLDAPTAARAWVTPVAGLPRLLLSDANTSYLLSDPAAPAQLTLRSEGLGAPASLWALPAPPGGISMAGAPLAPPVAEGLFARFSVPLPAAAPASVTAALLRPADPARVQAPTPQQPSADGVLGEFEGAQVYSISVAGGEGLSEDWDVRLRVAYVGDCARLYRGASTAREDLLGDHFFNGHPMELPYTRQGGSAGLGDAFTLRVLPLALNAEPPDARFPWGQILFEVPPAFNASGVAVGLQGIEAVHTYSALLTFQ